MDNLKKFHPTKIKKTLLDLGLIKNENLEIFSKKTRDVENLYVYRDTESKLIFIDNFYTGNETYELGKYRTDSLSVKQKTSGEYEDIEDTQRRFEQFKQFTINKKICDFGCGNGGFLRKSVKLSKHSIGLELQKNFIDSLNNDGIDCYDKIEKIDSDLDTIFMFHTFEHLPDPMGTLKTLHKKLKDSESHVVIEVPHAKDFLLDTMELESFKDFTLWSQHLILHTRESLETFLINAGFKNIIIKGFQRYGLANHLFWLRHNQPGGHKSNFAKLESENLSSSYSLSLSNIDANDTLIAIATK